MPPKTPHPIPFLRLHNGGWKIVWHYAGTQFSVSTGLKEAEKLFAGRWLADFAIALKQDIPAFPEQYGAAPDVERYVAKRYGGITNATPDNVSRYLGKIAKTKKPATRNQILVI